jgi:plastocyanin
LIGVAAAFTGVLLFSIVGMPSLSSAQPQGEGQEQQQQQANNNAGQNGTMMTVATGAGGPESVLIAYEPQNVTINVGQTVVWTNPTVVGEPHTVSFIRQPDYFAAIESPYLIANGTELTPANPNEKNTEPLIITGQNNGIMDNTIITANKRATLPAVVDSQNK